MLLQTVVLVSVIASLSFALNLILLFCRPASLASCCSPEQLPQKLESLRVKKRKLQGKQKRLYRAPVAASFTMDTDSTMTSSDSDKELELFAQTRSKTLQSESGDFLSKVGERRRPSGDSVSSAHALLAKPPFCAPSSAGLYMQSRAAMPDITQTEHEAVRTSQEAATTNVKPMEDLSQDPSGEQDIFGGF